MRSSRRTHFYYTSVASFATSLRFTERGKYHKPSLEGTRSTSLGVELTGRPNLASRSPHLGSGTSPVHPRETRTCVDERRELRGSEANYADPSSSNSAASKRDGRLPEEPAADSRRDERPRQEPDHARYTRRDDGQRQRGRAGAFLTPAFAPATFHKFCQRQRAKLGTMPPTDPSRSPPRLNPTDHRPRARAARGASTDQIRLGRGG